MTRRGESLFVVVLILFSAAALWEAYGIAGFSKWSSPGVFPMLASATMLVCALFILRDSRAHNAKQEKESLVDSVLPTRIVVISLLMVMYVVAMPTLGFLLDSGLFLFASISYLWTKPIWMALLVSLASLLVIHIVFRLVFQVILPQGTLIQMVL